MATGLQWIREDAPCWDADKQRLFGEFIIDHLEAEAVARGLNYIYNVVPATSPNPEWVTAWLVGHGFVAGDGDLRRRVREGRGRLAAGRRPQWPSAVSTILMITMIIAIAR